MESVTETFGGGLMQESIMNGHGKEEEINNTDKEIGVIGNNEKGIVSENQRTIQITDLVVEVDNKTVLQGINLTIEKGKIHVLMGQNGSGKSSLAHVIMGNPNYKVVSGKILLDGEDITTLSPEVRAKKGIFLSFQQPTEIAGLSTTTFLRTAVNKQREERKEKAHSVVEFHKLLSGKMDELRIDNSFRKRGVNEGFSGGEKKRHEILQMGLLQPDFSLLDEIDSGLDVDALKTVAAYINEQHKQRQMGIVLITHYNRFLNLLSADKVTVLHEGKIIATGGPELAEQIEQNGFENFGSVKKDNFKDVERDLNGK